MKSQNENTSVKRKQRTKESEQIRTRNSAITRQMPKALKDAHQYLDFKFNGKLSIMNEVNFENICYYSYMVNNEIDWYEVKKMMARVLANEKSTKKDIFHSPSSIGIGWESLKKLLDSVDYYAMDLSEYSNKKAKVYKDLTFEDFENSVLANTKIIIINLNIDYSLNINSKNDRNRKYYFYFFKLWLDILSHPDFIKMQESRQGSVNYTDINNFLYYQLYRVFDNNYWYFIEKLEGLCKEYPNSRWCNDILSWIDSIKRNIDKHYSENVLNIPGVTAEDYPEYLKKRKRNDNLTTLTEREISFLFRELFINITPGLKRNNLFIAQLASAVSGFSEKKIRQSMSEKNLSLKESERLIQLCQKLSNQFKL